MKKILVVEDMDVRIKVFKQILKGYDVDFCVNAPDAIENIKNKKYDWIFLDHDLDQALFQNSSDENTGYTVAKFLVEQPWIKQCFVVVHSINPVGAKNIVRILHLPDENHIPFDRKLYLEEMRNIMERCFHEK